MKASSLEPAKDFKLLGERPIDALGLHIAQYEHVPTGARHLHMDAKQKENVFMVALRTVPGDSTGVAHILEHTALCGSKRYPVRDPFFMMLRRSLNTFMNAFTGSDWTAYPFATQNRKDFDNLLRVYLDAVFFPRLDPLDFAQEGHRVEYADEAGADGGLQYCGVVYNEMKGAMSAVPSQLWQSICAELYPTTTYKHNSGGNPEDILNLSHKQLVDFHRRHYHPSNAVFMSFGDIPAQQHQAQFNEYVLRHFERGDTDIIVPTEQRYKKPRRAKAVYSASPEHLKDENNAYLLMNWLLCDNTDFDAVANISLATGVLLNNSASPLRRLLETSTLGKAPSSMTGLMSEHRELVLVCGIEGARAQDAEAFEQEVMHVLENVATHGVEQEEAESVLHQYELQHREIGGDSYPYGLQLLLRCLPTTLYRGEVLSVLDMDAVLKRLKKDIKDPDFIAGQIRTQLLDNPHRLCLSAVADAQLHERQSSAERKKLDKLSRTLVKGERDNIIRLSLVLKDRQQRKDSSDILPRVRVSDVPADINTLSPVTDIDISLPLTAYHRPTNGLVYQHAVLPMPEFSQEQMELVPLYTCFVTGVGTGQDDYLRTQQRQAAISGGVRCSASVRGKPHNAQEYGAHIVFSTRGLVRNSAAISALLRDTVRQARFDEQQRLRALLTEARARVEEHLTQDGHQLAMACATATMSPVAAWVHRTDGLPSVRKLKELDRAISDDKVLAQLGEQLGAMHDLVMAQKLNFLLVAERSTLPGCVADVQHCWPEHSLATGTSMLKLDAVEGKVRQLWRIQSQVNFCSRAWRTVPYTHKDAPVLAVLAALLRNGFLHRAIREQGGAYGGGARQNSDIASFVCYSYRDPRLEQTLDDFDRAIQWLHTHKHSADELEEAILGVVGVIDKPRAPAGAAIGDFYDHLYGYSHTIQRQYRQRVLHTSVEDVLRVSAEYLNLKPKSAHTAVITPLNAGGSLLAQGYELHGLDGDVAQASVAVA